MSESLYHPAGRASDFATRSVDPDVRPIDSTCQPLPPVPEVGMGATIILGRDRVATTVRRVLSPTRLLLATSDGAAGIATRRPDGSWRLKGCQTPVLLGATTASEEADREEDHAATS